MRIKSEHPFWGYRRVWSYLRFREHKILNVKRIYRIMCENELLVSRPALKALRTNSNRSKPRAIKPNEYWGIDMMTPDVNNGHEKFMLHPFFYKNFVHMRLTPDVNNGHEKFMLHSFFYKNFVHMRQEISSLIFPVCVVDCKIFQCIL